MDPLSALLGAGPAALDGGLHPGRLLAALHGAVTDMDQLAARLPTEDLLVDPPLDAD